MKEKIQIIRMVCGLLRNKNTGIILCRDSKKRSVLCLGQGRDIAVEIAKVMGKDKSIREVFASGVLVHIIAEGSVPALNKSGLLNLKKNLGKDYCGRRGEMKQFDIEKAKNGAAVCLRDGTPVKILDFDFNGNVLYKYVHIDQDGTRIEELERADKNGLCLHYISGGLDKDKDLFMSPKYGFMNVFKATDNSSLVGGVIRTTFEECSEAGKTDLKENLKWFCVARVELLEEVEEVSHV